LAMLKPPEQMNDWRVWAVSDDITWMHLDNNGELRAINPEMGFFGVAPNTNQETNPNIMNTIKKNTIFTNVAITKMGNPWWEGMGDPPGGLWDWQGNEWKGQSPAAHPNSRFTTSINQYPNVSARFNDPTGVPISAIMFGGRRAKLIPLILEAYSWEEGVLLAAMMKVETTAAAEVEVGVVRTDPMAMKPFCGYNMGDYFKHWMTFRSKSNNLPKIFLFNAFRRDKNGKYLWPGYVQNLGILKWIIDRCSTKVAAVETAIGYVPIPDSLNLNGLAIDRQTIQELLLVNKEEWQSELESSQLLFDTFGERFPGELRKAHSKLMDRLRN
jgi:phosphoenolpyruvate carboxykinase (GTP)